MKIDIEREEVDPAMDQDMSDSLGVSSEPSQDSYIPQYKMYANSKLPVSKAESRLWQTRLKQCKISMRDISAHWDKAYKYFDADQVHNRSDSAEEGGSSRKMHKETRGIENVIYNNIMGMLPNLYSQNPSVDITANSDNQDNVSMAKYLQRILNVVLQNRVAPGINMQPKARKAILNSMITNRGAIKIGWTNKNTTNEQAIKDIQDISDKLVNAKDTKEIEELEGQLMALDEMVDLTESSCLYASHVEPFNLFIDPCALEQDGSDAKWMIERVLLPTEWLKAKFGVKKEEETRLIYNEASVMQLSDDGSLDDDYSNLGNFNDNLGYTDEDTFEKSQLSTCYWVWDKVKRRVSLYSEGSWEYPLWVYDDPYHLQEFFPYYVLNFYESPMDVMAKGEVSLYTDQQDEINAINAQLVKMRDFSFNKYLFNTASGIAKKDIENWLNNKNNIVGLQLPPGTRFEDVLYCAQVPYDKNQALFDKGDLLRQVDAASGTDATTRSGEYKTNTTNMAIQTYMAGKNIKQDDKRDLIERWLGNISWGLAQLVLQYMDTEQVFEILGEMPQGIQWKNYTSLEIRQIFSLTCVGGSTQRPNSATKQQQAMAIGQLLGQFASATPMALVVMLKMMSKAFDSFVVKSDDIDLIIQSIQQQLQAQQQQQQAQTQALEADAAVKEEQAVSQAMANDLPVNNQAPIGADPLM